MNMQKNKQIMLLSLCLAVVLAIGSCGGDTLPEPADISCDISATKSVDATTLKKMAEYLKNHGFLQEAESDFDYNRRVSKLEAVVLAVRLMNCEKYALSNDWADESDESLAQGNCYVSCALSIKLLKDGDNMLPASEADISAHEFVTLLLRALGYDDTLGHFDPDVPWRLSDHIGLTNGCYSATSDDFTFEDMVSLSYIALCTNIKNEPMSMHYYYFAYRQQPGTSPSEVLCATADYLCIDQFDSYKETYVGGTRGGCIGYAGGQAILSYSISDPSVISFEFTEVYSYTNFGFEDSVMQNFEITGLKTGRATVEITFAEGQGDPCAIAFIDVVVFDEIWPGYPYFENNWKLSILQDSLVDGCYTRFLLADGNNKIYFDGLCEVGWSEDYALTVADLTGDSVGDIAVIFTAAHGTGCLIQEAHIFDGVTFEEYEVKNAVELAYEHLKLSADDDAFYIDIESERDTFVINKAEIISKSDYDVDLYPLPFFGLICQYAIQDGRLCAYLPIQVGMTEFCGRIEILYRFDFNCFEFDSIKALGE